MKVLLSRKLILLAALTASVPAFSNVSYTCDPSINASICTYLNTTVAGYYNNTFTNANATIYIQFASNGGLGESDSGVGALVSYSTYQTQLEAESTDSAKTTVPATEPGLYSGGDVFLNNALANAIGFSFPDGAAFLPTSSGGDAANGWVSSTPCSNPGDGAVISSSSGCFNGVITLNDPADLAAENDGNGYSFRGVAANTGTSGNTYDFFSVVEHESDEILGTESCYYTTSAPSINDGCGGTNISTADLFRYSAANTRTINTVGGTAYFSADGGVTDLDGNMYDNQENGDDWADFSNVCEFVQDGIGCLDSQFDITTDGPGGTPGPEIAILNAIGYNLQSATPEPATFGLLCASFLTLGIMRYRR